MITEDYVLFEIAKLLKEKGFDELCFALYNPEEELIQCGVRLSNTQVGRVPGSYSAPTQSLALKWLREVHKIHISINVGCDVDNKNYIFYIPTIVKLNNKSVEYIDPFCEDEDEFDSNEEAVEAALLYVLKNLI